MKTFFALFILLCCAVVANATERSEKQNDLGGMEPAQALEYMKAEVVPGIWTVC